MKIANVISLSMPEVRIITYPRFADDRGYFTETYKKSDFGSNDKLDFLKNIEFVQANESHSKKGVIRGLHFQWNPPQSKLIRVIKGRMVDFFLDIRHGSPNFGKIAGYDMISSPNNKEGEWIWVPFGFAHGNLFLEETTIEYFVNSNWGPQGEAGISPMSPDIDWSLCDPKIKERFDNTVKEGAIISQKDKEGYTIESWKNNPASHNFIYQAP